LLFLQDNQILSHIPILCLFKVCNRGRKSTPLNEIVFISSAPLILIYLMQSQNMALVYCRRFSIFITCYKEMSLYQIQCCSSFGKNSLVFDSCQLPPHHLRL
jgi:hypothetical protein